MNQDAIFFDGTTNIPSDGTRTLEKNAAIIVGVAFAVVFAVLVTCIIVGLVYFLKFRKRGKRFRPLQAQLQDLKLNTHLQDIVLGERLGGGHYGTVFRGEWKGSDIAAKRIEDDDFQAIENEINILKHLKHPHVVAYLGVSVVDIEFYIITEFCSDGDLLSWLQRTFELQQNLLSDISRQIASGMEYLHSREPSVIHRDLAARNILLTGDKSHPTCKVADFGMSTSQGEMLDENAQVPIRWSPPETLRSGEFSQKTDV